MTVHEKIKQLAEDYPNGIARRKAARFCRKATRQDWVNWLDEYIERNEISNPFTVWHSVSFEGMADDFFVAEKDFTLFPSYGSYAIRLIIPENITVRFDELGHNELYMHGDPPKTSPDASIPYYLNLG